MGNNKAGWWIAGACAVVILISVGYGMGRRAALRSLPSPVPPAGAPVSTIQIEPIQPQEELAAISSPTAAPPSTATSPAGPSVSPTAPSLEESARVKEIQKALKAAGFDPGPIDGQMGIRTRTAIRDFQTAHGLEPDGKVGPKTWSKLESFLKEGQSASNR